MKMSTSSVPYVIESFVACDSRILCAEVIKDENQFNDPNKRKSFCLVWNNIWKVIFLFFIADLFF